MHLSVVSFFPLINDDLADTRYLYVSEKLVIARFFHTICPILS